MKLHIEKELLQDAINTVIRAVPAKSTIPALEGLLMDAHGETLTVTAYNTQTAIRTRYAAEIEREGRIVINAKLLSDIIRKMPDDTVTLDCDTEKMTVKLKCVNTDYNVSALLAGDYPELPEVEDNNRLEIKEATLKSMIAETNFAVSTNETRPVQTGALFAVESGSLNVVACDGFRLAVRSEQVRGNDIEFVVPGNALAEVERICEDSQNDASITVGNRHVEFTFGSTELISRRLDGQFLDWRNVIPKDNTITVKVDAKSMMRSIDRVSVVVNEKLKSPMRCKIGDGEITMSTKTTIGAANDRCKIEGDGKDLEIGFNNRYLGDAFRYAPETELCMSFKNSASPAVITAANGEKNFLYMVLPVRLKKD